MDRIRLFADFVHLGNDVRYVRISDNGLCIHDATVICSIGNASRITFCKAADGFLNSHKTGKTIFSVATGNIFSVAMRPTRDFVMKLFKSV